MSQRRLTSKFATNADTGRGARCWRGRRQQNAVDCDCPLSKIKITAMALIRIPGLYRINQCTQSNHLLELLPPEALRKACEAERMMRWGYFAVCRLAGGGLYHACENLTKQSLLRSSAHLAGH